MIDITGKQLLSVVKHIAEKLEEEGHEVILFKETYTYTKSFIDGWEYDISHYAKSVKEYLPLVEKYLDNCEKMLAHKICERREIELPKYNKVYREILSIYKERIRKKLKPGLQFHDIDNRRWSEITKISGDDIWFSFGVDGHLHGFMKTDYLIQTVLRSPLNKNLYTKEQEQ